jgi:hypothetical protein
MITLRFLVVFGVLCTAFPVASSAQDKEGKDKRASASADEVGCCCFKNDLKWDCTGSKPGTQVTKAQCKKDANDLGLTREGIDWKWSAGTCKESSAKQSDKKAK